jgi:hypothetical protein
MATKNTNIGIHTSKGQLPKSHIMVTLPPATRLQLEAIAQKEDRSLSYLCRHFIEQGLNAKKSPNKNKN